MRIISKINAPNPLAHTLVRYNHRRRSIICGQPTGQAVRHSGTISSAAAAGQQASSVTKVTERKFVGQSFSRIRLPKAQQQRLHSNVHYYYFNVDLPYDDVVCIYLIFKPPPAATRAKDSHSFTFQPTRC